MQRRWFVPAVRQSVKQFGSHARPGNWAERCQELPQTRERACYSLQSLRTVLAELGAQLVKESGHQVICTIEEPGIEAHNSTRGAIPLKCLRDHIENGSLARTPLAHNSDSETMLSWDSEYLVSYCFGKRPPRQTVLFAALNGSVSVIVLSCGRNLFVQGRLPLQAIVGGTEDVLGNRSQQVVDQEGG